jgi:hypothetical protein
VVLRCLHPRSLHSVYAQTAEPPGSAAKGNPYSAGSGTGQVSVLSIAMEGLATVPNSTAPVPLIPLAELSMHWVETAVKCSKLRKNARVCSGGPPDRVRGQASTMARTSTAGGFRSAAPGSLDRTRRWELGVGSGGFSAGHRSLEGARLTFPNSYERYRKFAREVETDESPETVERAFRKIVPPKTAE